MRRYQRPRSADERPEAGASRWALRPQNRPAGPGCIPRPAGLWPENRRAGWSSSSTAGWCSRTERTAGGRRSTPADGRGLRLRGSAAQRADRVRAVIGVEVPAHRARDVVPGRTPGQGLGAARPLDLDPAGRAEPDPETAEVGRAGHGAGVAADHGRCSRTPDRSQGSQTQKSARCSGNPPDRSIGCPETADQSCGLTHRALRWHW